MAGIWHNSWASNRSTFWYACQGISSALKNRSLLNLTCSKYIYGSKWVDRFWPVKASSFIVEGGQNDSQNQSKIPLCAHLGQQSETGSWLILTTIDEFQINEINVDLRTSGFDNEVLSVDACAVWWERESFYCLPRISVVTWHREPRFQCGSARTCSIWNSSIATCHKSSAVVGGLTEKLITVSQFGTWFYI